MVFYVLFFVFKRCLNTVYHPYLMSRCLKAMYSYVRTSERRKKTPTLRCAQPRFDRFEIWFYNTDTRYPSSDRNSHSISKTCYWLFLKSAIGFGWAVLLISRFMARHFYRFFRVSNKQAFCGNSNRDWSNGAFVYVSLSTIDTVARKSYWIRYN